MAKDSTRYFLTALARRKTVQKSLESNLDALNLYYEFKSKVVGSAFISAWLPVCIHHMRQKVVSEDR